MNDRVAEELYPCGVRVNVLSLGVRKTKLRSPALGNKKSVHSGSAGCAHDQK